MQTWFLSNSGGYLFDPAMPQLSNLAALGVAGLGLVGTVVAAAIGIAIIAVLGWFLWGWYKAQQAKRQAQYSTRSKHPMRQAIAPIPSTNGQQINEYWSTFIRGSSALNRGDRLGLKPPS